MGKKKKKQIDPFIENKIRYRKEFNCDITLREPDGYRMLFDDVTEKLYDIDKYSYDELNEMMEECFKTGKNVLLEACIDKEIERKVTPPWIDL